LFSIEKDTDSLTEIDDLVNPSLRLHENVMSGERQGRMFNRGRNSRVALGEAHVHKRLSAERFARRVVVAIQGCCDKRSYECIFLAADPEFTGLLRPQLTTRHLQPPVREIPKNLTRQSLAGIRSHLPKNPWKRSAHGAGA
jgi:protein required for attachment to host cells